MAGREIRPPCAAVPAAARRPWSDRRDTCASLSAVEVVDSNGVVRAVCRMHEAAYARAEGNVGAYTIGDIERLWRWR